MFVLLSSRTGLIFCNSHEGTGTGAMARRLFYTPSPHCWSLGMGCSYLAEEEPPLLMGESMAGKKEETSWYLSWAFLVNCFFILYLLLLYCCFYSSFSYLITDFSKMFLSQSLISTFYGFNSQLHLARLGRKRGRAREQAVSGRILVATLNWRHCICTVRMKITKSTMGLLIKKEFFTLPIRNR